MCEMVILGVDPGLSGAIAFYRPAEPTRVTVYDMPVADKRVDGATLARLIEQSRPKLAFIESVAAMPGQGVASTFNFGAAFGTAIGVIQGLRIPHHRVAPARWKKTLSLNADKERSRAMALRVFTDSAEHFARKKDDGRAEAALIAFYGAESLSMTADRIEEARKLDYV